MSYPRTTPVYAAQDVVAPRWGERFGMMVALGFADPAEESHRLSELALADVSALPRLGVKGSAAEAWLCEHDFPAPAAIYGWVRTEDHGLVIRVDRDEFLVEDGLDNGPVGRLSTELGFGAGGAWRVERQDASVLITGRQALDVFGQTCGVNVAEQADAFFKTRIALTSCSVLRDDVAGVPGYRLWVEPSYGHYLWEVLHEIVIELGGGPVGWECLERSARGWDPTTGAGGRDREP